MKFGRILLAGALLAFIVGCSKTEVSDQDVKDWAKAKDSNGKPLANAPSESPYDQR